MKYDVVVVANGKGKRAGLGYNKVFFVMKNNKTVLENSCSVFVNDDDCKKIIIVTDDKEKVFSNSKLVIVNGGEKRIDSVINGLKCVESETVFIHDAARPFLLKEDVDKLKIEVEKHDAAILVSKTINTLKKVKEGVIEKTVDRNNIYNALTPQAFKTELIKDAYNKLNDSDITDDSQVVEKLGKKVYIVEASPSNIKLTDKVDFENI